jgi:anaerobic carbon-monoxide dehydrogenase iron sulfur subunit
MTRDRFLSIDPVRCTGCRECEVACSKRHTGRKRGGRPRIQVLGAGAESIGFHFPVTCQQCSDPPCMAACPRNAIHRDPELGSVVLEEKMCVGCKMCVSACPTGAMGFDPDLGFAYKCDLCGGDPQCAHVCQPKAIEYEPPQRIQHIRMIQSASKLYQAIRNQVASPTL